MRTKFWIPLALFALLLMPACGSDSPTDNNPPPDEPNDMSDALAGYWDAQEDITGELLELGEIMEAIEATIDRGIRSQEQMDEVAAYVEQYVAKSEQVAGQFDDMIEMEERIVPYGDRGMFTDVVGGVCKGVYNAAKGAVVSSGQMVRTGWRVMSGSHGLREALSAPDSGIPLVSGWAQDLQRTAQRRNQYIAQEIANGDYHAGWIPSVPGSTPQERAQNYMNLPENDPIKRTAHQNFLLWSEEGWEDCLTTLKDASKTGVKAYGEAVSGSGVLVEVTEQLVSPDQDEGDKAPVTPEIRDMETEDPIENPKTMIISKRNQPESEPKIVVLEGVDPEFEVELPSGSYDIITIAEDYIRAAELNLQVAAEQATGFLAELLEFASNAIVLESVVASPDVAGIGQTVVCVADAASTIGSSLQFDWSIEGGSYTNLEQDGRQCSFKPGAEGDYLVHLTVTDDFGNSKSKSASVAVTPIEVDVVAVEIVVEQFLDSELNPGETVTVELEVFNGSDDDLTGDMSLAGLEGSSADGQFADVTVAAGGTETRQFTVQLPVDWSEDSASVLFSFETPTVIIQQEVVFDVAFFVEIDEIFSPVTERILTLSGRVANPSLTIVHLVIDGDYEQLYEVNAYNGFWMQDVIIEGSTEEVDHSVTLQADSGSWREEDTADFTSQVPPAGFRVTLTWDTGGTDVDLWVTDPFGNRCYFGNDYVEASGLTLDADDTSGYGPENITSEEPPAGPYFVQVHYWSDHDPENAIGTNCTIVIREKEGTPEETVRYYSGFLGDTGDLWDVTTIEVGTRAEGSGEPIDHYHWIDPATLPAK